MKNIFKTILLYTLKMFAKAYIFVYKIEVVAITGSAGKTTAKNTIKKLTEELKSVYVPTEAYNTEFGVPMAIFREKSPVNPSSLKLWLKLIARVLFKLFRRPEFQVIVLEYGADKPGDIRYLCDIARPKIALITTILPAHLEGFGDIEKIAFEKKSLVWMLKKGGLGIVNGDSKYLKNEFKELRNVLTISTEDKDSDFYVSDLKSTLDGTSFSLQYDGEMIRLTTPVVGDHLIYSMVGGIAVASLLGVSKKDIISSFRCLEPEKGRMNILKSKNGYTIIDDSYNSNPEALALSLKFLSDQKGRRIAVLGNMNELGKDSLEIHKSLGETIIKSVDVLLTIGDLAEEGFARPLEKNSKVSLIRSFDNSFLAGEYLVKIIKKGDIILFKGSQNGVFAEEAIVPLLDDDQDAEALLVRQSSFWKNKKVKGAK